MITWVSMSTFVARYNIYMSNTFLIFVANELVEPAEDFIMPLEAISMIQYPVVLVREDDQTAWYTELLQSMERTNTLCLRQPEVFAAMDQELRGRPLVNKIRWIIFLGEFFALKVPGSASPFVVEEKELICAVAIVGGIKDAVVADKCLEVKPELRVALDPVNCITTPTATSSHSTVRVDLGESLQNMLPAIDHVDEWLASPVLRNCIRKFLAKGCATCWVDSNDKITLLGKDIGIPTS